MEHSALHFVENIARCETSDGKLVSSSNWSRQKACIEIINYIKDVRVESVCEC